MNSNLRYPYSCTVRAVGEPPPYRGEIPSRRSASTGRSAWYQTLRAGRQNVGQEHGIKLRAIEYLLFPNRAGPSFGGRVVERFPIGRR